MPRFKFTAKSAPPTPSNGQADYWDTSLPGFGQRVSAGGTRTWIAMYRYNGKKRRMKIGNSMSKSLADAREEAREVFRRAEKGADPATERKVLRSKSETFEDIADRYVDEYAKVKKRSWKKDRQILDAEVIPVIGTKRIGDVRRGDIHEVLKPIIERGSLIRANHTLEVVRKLFNWYSSILDEPLVNPAGGIAKPGQVEHRGRYLSADELKRFWIALKPDTLGEEGEAAFKLLTLTMQREMEVLRMRWQDIDLEEWTWVVPGDHAKNALEHVVPLTPIAAKLLRQLKVRAGKQDVYVFKSPVKAGEHVRRIFIAKRMDKIRKSAELVDVTPHDLRRTGTTYLGKLKVEQVIKKKILNHTKRRKSDVTEIYDRYEYLGLLPVSKTPS